MTASTAKDCYARRARWYRAPFPTPESRRPTWRFPNDLRIAGEPAGVYQTLERADDALRRSTYPKLLISGNPGALVTPTLAENFGKELTNCRVVQLSSGLDHLQEDHPDVVGAYLKEWLVELGVRCRPRQTPEKITAWGNEVSHDAHRDGSRIGNPRSLIAATDNKKSSLSAAAFRMEMSTFSASAIKISVTGKHEGNEHKQR
jgi:hypothetical protein